MNAKPHPTLAEAKRVVKDQLLGKLSVHAIGAKSSQGTVYVYCCQHSENLQLEIDRLLESVHPYKIVVRVEDSPGAVT